MSNPRSVEVYWKVVCGMCLQWWTYCKFMQIYHLRTCPFLNSQGHPLLNHGATRGSFIDAIIDMESYAASLKTLECFFLPTIQEDDEPAGLNSLFELRIVAGNTQVSFPLMPNIAGVLRELPGALWRCHAFPGDSAEPVDFDQDTAPENDGTLVDSWHAWPFQQKVWPMLVLLSICGNLHGSLGKSHHVSCHGQAPGRGNKNCCFPKNWKLLQ